MCMEKKRKKRKRKEREKEKKEKKRKKERKRKGKKDMKRDESSEDQIKCKEGCHVVERRNFHSFSNHVQFDNEDVIGAS